MENFDFTLLYNIVLFAGCVLGIAAIFYDTHMHGWTQFIVFGVMTLVACSVFVSMVSMEPVGPVVSFFAKLQTICGVCVLAREAAHVLNHHHHNGWALGAWVAGILVVIGVLVWSPDRGVHSPVPSLADIVLPTPQFPPAGTPRPHVPNFGTANTGGGSTATATSATTPARKKTVIYSTLSSVESQKDIVPLDCDSLSPLLRASDTRCATSP